jgi:hypothetical protein
MKMKIKSLCVQALKKSRTLAAALALALMSTVVWAQPIVPFTLVNRTNPTIADANIFVAVVGIQNGNHVWIDTKTGAVRLMNASDNTVQGPVIGGNQGPGGNGRYANCFARLSEIPNKIINIPGIAGCRILISFNQQLYLYFFGASGAPSGYAAPNLANPTDPNQGIRFEMIELTNAPNGLWANTTRVDTYQYPMGLEVWGSGFYGKTGELMTHAQILSQWSSTAPAAFAGCYDAAKGIIHFPSKTAAFQPGGAQANYFGAYIDQIWSKYTGGDLVFDSGHAGVWRGRVSGSQFRFTRASDGQVAIIPSKPTTQDALEAKGALATGAQWDLVVQAQVAAAINRHAIDLNIATGANQDFATPSKYYVTSPYNWYARFWHRTDISFNGRTYAFSYDDVFDQSSTLNAGSPQRATISIGGFAGTSCNPTTITPYLTVNGGAWQQTGNATLNAGGSFTLGPNPTTGGSWSWTGPGGFTSTSREITRTNVTTAMAGQYVARHTNDCGAQSTFTYNITINGVGGGVATMYQDCNYGGAAVALPLGDYNLAAMTSRGIANDWISSLRVTSGHRVTLYENDNFTGASLVVTADNSCLVAAGWNDRTTSMRVATNTTSFSTVIQAESWISMAGVATETTTDAGGGLNVGWIEAGDWMAYNITIPTTGTYRVIYRVASPNANMTLRLEKDAGATQLGTVTVPNTGGWQNWQNVAHNVTLPAGTYAIGLATATGGFNINYLTVTNNLSAREDVSDFMTEEEEAGAFVLSPNPAKSQLYINGFENVKRVKIYNIQGQEMISVENPGRSISVESLRPGLHIAIIERKDLTFRKEKVLIEK